MPTGVKQNQAQDDKKRTVSVIGEASYSEGISYWRLGQEMQPGAEKDAMAGGQVVIQPPEGTQRVGEVPPVVSGQEAAFVERQAGVVGQDAQR